MRRKVIAFGNLEPEREPKSEIHHLSTRNGRPMPVKFIRHIKEHGNLYELRMKYESNIYRVFFIFDEGQIVVLFHGFQKKSQKTSKTEIEKAIRIRKEYYEQKGTTHL